mgnify:CR=1 FL=1
MPIIRVFGERVFRPYYKEPPRKGEYQVKKEIYKSSWLEDDARDIFGAVSEKSSAHQCVIM